MMMMMMMMMNRRHGLQKYQVELCEENVNSLVAGR